MSANSNATPSLNTNLNREPDERILQPSLFGPLAERVEGVEMASAAINPLTAIYAPLTHQSSLTVCSLPYQAHLMSSLRSKHTITCFLSDLHLLIDYLAVKVGRDLPLGEITPQYLTDWLIWVRHLRGQTAAPKTVARRTTFLRNFFSWLAAEGIIPEDPSAPLVLMRPIPPLPEILFDNEVEQLLAVAATTDSRAHLMVVLLLEAGLKKEELMGLKLRHIDLSTPTEPELAIHYPGQVKRHKERKLKLPGSFTPLLDKYLHVYQPQERLFTCTDRNLNYILARMVKTAGIRKKVSLQILRDTYAVRQLRRGVSLEDLRVKLGLTDEAWKESAEKYIKLAFPAGLLNGLVPK